MTNYNYRMVLTNEKNNEKIYIPLAFTFSDILPTPKKSFQSSLSYSSKDESRIKNILNTHRSFRKVLKQQIDKYTPNLILSRFDDLEAKYNILYYSQRKIEELIESIKKSYNFENKEVTLDEKYWELELHINNFFNEEEQ